MNDDNSKILNLDEEFTMFAEEIIQNTNPITDEDMGYFIDVCDKVPNMKIYYFIGGGR